MNEEKNTANENNSLISDETSELPAQADVLVFQNKPPKRTAVHFFFDVIEMFAWSVLIVLLLFSFAVRLCRVEGASMENTLYEGENLLIWSLGYSPEQDDIIVFHKTHPINNVTDEEGSENRELTIVKRVIATAGQSVVIDFNTAKIYIDGQEYKDTHKVLKDKMEHDLGFYTLKASHHYNIYTNTFSVTVPDGHVFVMGDNRNFSRDSRDPSIGFVDERCILGKAIVRFAPFTVFS